MLKSYQQNQYNQKPLVTTVTLLSNERTHSMQIRFMYCQRLHWNDECLTLKSLTERKNALKGKCYICLKPNDPMKDCKNEKTCYFSKKKHHHNRSLCPSLLKTSVNSKSVLTLTTSSMGETPQESSMLFTGEQVVMQAAFAESVNPDESSHEPVGIFLDSSSH